MPAPAVGEEATSKGANAGTEHCAERVDAHVPAALLWRRNVADGARPECDDGC